MGHIKSILPQSGGVSPVDNDTVALFRYKENTNDSLKGVRHIGETAALLPSETTHMVVEGPPDISETNELTVSTWFKRAGVAGSGHHILFVQDDLEVEISVKESTGELRTGLYIDGTRNVFNSGSGLFDGNWHHLALAYDGSKIRSYINGVEKGSLAISGVLSKGSSWSFGRYDQYYADAHQSDIRVFNRSLSAREILEVMNNKEVKNGLIGHWRLTEGLGRIAYDSSTNGNDGIIDTPEWGKGSSQYSLEDSGVLIEEPSSNKIVNPTGPDTWMNNSDPVYGHVSSEIVDTLFGVKGLQKTVKRVGTTDYRGALIGAYWNTPTDMSKPHTFSIYVRIAGGEPGSLTLNYQGVDSTGARIDISESHPISSSDWQRITISHVLADSDFVSLISYMKLYLYPPGAADATTSFQIVCPQMEEKTYATSFTKSERVAGRLQYLLPAVAAPMTCSFWFRRKAGNFTSQLINLIDNTGDWKVWLDWSNDMSFSIANFADTGTVSYGRIDGGIVSNDWTFIAFAITPTQLLLYQDGEEIGTSTHGAALPLFEKLTVGHHTESTQPPINGLFAELRIDKVARTAAEIRAWYHQGRNGW